MCGRFTQTKNREEVLEELSEIELPPLFHGRYNVAPAQPIAVIRQQQPQRAESCIWGMEGPSLIINARFESLRERPLFRDLILSNRCLIPADGFFEWKDRQPWYFQLPSKHLFAFAGLHRDGRCVIITRAADSTMRGIHDRMPVIIQRPHWEQWLWQDLQLPQPPELSARPVSRRVNSIANDDSACLLPGEVQTDLSLFPDDS